MKKKQNGDKKRNSFFKIIKLIVIIFFVSFMLSIFSKCDADGLGGLIKVPDWWPDGWFDLFYKEEPDDSGNGDSSENTDGSGSIIEGDVTESGIYTITFDANGGELIGETTMQTNAEGYIEMLSATAEREDYLFNGWYTEPDAGFKVGVGDRLEANVTLYAHWVEFFTITFNANGGTFSKNDIITIETNNVGILEDLPNEPTKSGYTFIGWYLSNGDGPYTLSGTTFFSDTTLYAHWKESGIYTITFNPNGGEVLTDKMETGTNGKLSSYPIAARTNYVFDGWYTALENGERVSTSTIFTENTTVYAHWIEYLVTVIFDSNGGNLTGVQSMTTNSSGKLLELPSEPTRENYTFLGWYTQPNDGTQVSIYTTFKVDTIVYAHWRAYQSVTITFDANGGELSDVSSLVTQADGTLSTLPNNPTREDYVFYGWSFYPDYSLYITTTTIFNEDTIVYAVWGLSDDGDGAFGNESNAGLSLDNAAYASRSIYWGDTVDGQTPAMSSKDFKIMWLFDTADLKDTYAPVFQITRVTCTETDFYIDFTFEERALDWFWIYDISFSLYAYDGALYPIDYSYKYEFNPAQGPNGFIGGTGICMGAFLADTSTFFLNNDIFAVFEVHVTAMSDIEVYIRECDADTLGTPFGGGEIFGPFIISAANLNLDEEFPYLRSIRVVGFCEDGIVVYIHSTYDWFIYDVNSLGFYPHSTFNEILPYGGFYAVNSGPIYITVVDGDSYNETVDGELIVTFEETTNGIEVLITDGYGNVYEPDEVGLQYRTVYNDDGTCTFDFYFVSLDDGSQLILSGADALTSEGTASNSANVNVGPSGGYIIYEACDIGNIQVKLYINKSVG